MLHDYCGKIDTKTFCQYISNAETQSHINKLDVSMQTDVLTYNVSMQTEDYGFYAPLRPEHLLKEVFRLYTSIPMLRFLMQFLMNVCLISVILKIGKGL